jgi:hypothetical protein
MSAFDTQVGGGHYAKYAIQPLEFIVKNKIGFLEGNVIKYVVRWKDKAGLEDLKKARHYLDMLIELEQRKEESGIEKAIAIQREQWGIAQGYQQDLQNQYNNLNGNVK